MKIILRNLIQFANTMFLVLSTILSSVGAMYVTGSELTTPQDTEISTEATIPSLEREETHEKDVTIEEQGERQLYQNEESNNLLDQEIDIGLKANRDTEQEIKKPQTEIEEIGGMEFKELSEASLEADTEFISCYSELVSAIENPNVALIVLEQNISGATSLGSLNRDLKIIGQGHTIDILGNEGQLVLEILPEGQTAKLRIENITINKSYATANPNPIITASGDGEEWTLELENVNQLNTNPAGLVYLPEGKVAFTGGINNFTSTNSTNNTVFINAKEIEFAGGSAVTIDWGNSIILQSDVADASITIHEGAAVNITTASGESLNTSSTIDMSGENPRITVYGATFSVTSPGLNLQATPTFNNVIQFTNQLGIATLEILEDSAVNIQATGWRQGISGFSVDLRVQNSSFNIETVLGRCFNSDGNSSGISFEFDGAITNWKVMGTASLGNGAIVVTGNDASFTFKNGTQATFATQNDRNLSVFGNRSTVTIQSRSVVDFNQTITNATRNLEVINLHGNQTQFIVKDPGTEVNLLGANSGDRANLRLGDNITSNGTVLEVSNQAQLNVNVNHENLGTGIGLYGSDAQMLVNDGAAVLVESGPTRDTISPVSFISQGNSSLIVDGGRLDIHKSGGNAPAFRMAGGGNEIEVINQGKVTINHSESGTPSNGGEEGGNQGIFIASGAITTPNVIKVQGASSILDIQATSGPAIDLASNHAANIEVLNEASFLIEGHTLTKAGATIMTDQTIHMRIDNPHIVDIRNYGNNGHLFNVGSNSTLASSNSDLSLWYNGTSLIGEASQHWEPMNYNLTDQFFDTIVASTSLEFKTDFLGLASYSRMVSVGGPVVETILPVSPVDPLAPAEEVEPAYPEEEVDLPENQGLLSIDFISQFKFGTQIISSTPQYYPAFPQRLIDQAGVLIERPNYIQVSDRRPEGERDYWELSVTQDYQFRNKKRQELVGAQLILKNIQIDTAQGGIVPSVVKEEVYLTVGNRELLIQASGVEGQGTWVYRFGNEDNFKSSVILEVPGSTYPEDTTYRTRLNWTLSSVPGTELGH